MGRTSVEKRLKDNFGVDYKQLIKELEEKGFKPIQIKDYLWDKFNVTLQPATIKFHLNNNNKTKIGKKKSIEFKFQEIGLDYYKLLEDLSDLTVEEISEKFKQDYDISVKPNTIYGHANKRGIKLKHINTKTFSQITNFSQLAQLESNPKKEEAPQDLLKDKNPIYPKYFHATNDAGFLILKDTSIIVKVESFIQFKKSEANIGIYLKAFKNQKCEETKLLRYLEVHKDIVNIMTDDNYVKLCKEICSEYISQLQNAGTPKLKEILNRNARNPEEMLQITEADLLQTS